MSRLLAIAIGCTALVAQARGEELAVVTQIHGGELSLEGVEAVVWHALVDAHGQVPVELERIDHATVARMHEHGLRSLYHFDVSWEPLVVDLVDRGVVGSTVPRIEVTEYLLTGDELAQHASWTTYGALALYEVRRGGEAPLMVALPQVALQEAMSLAVDPIRIPSWNPPAEVIHIPVVVSADDEYREFYGPAWSQVADRRVARASAILGQAGLGLVIVGHQEWESPEEITGLSELLDVLAAGPRLAPSTIRIGFTQQTGLEVVWDEGVEDVGRAYMPGQEVLVADQAMAPGHLVGWDAAEEGAAVAHELLHALGLPHVEQPDLLMSATKSATVRQMSEPSRQLARAAAQARYAHWDAVTAMTSLGQVASAHIQGTPDQLDYITGNLAAGLGVPGPGEVEPGRLSALTNIAVGRYYLRLAETEPVNALALRQSALVHSTTALEQEPALVERSEMAELIEAVWRQGQEVVEPPPPPARERPVFRCATAYEGTPWFGSSTCPE